MTYRLNKLRDSSTSKKEWDSIFEGLLKEKNDEDLKYRWSTLLDFHHDIQRNKEEKETGIFHFQNLKILLVAACISLLIAIPFFSNSAEDPQTMALQYLNDQEILHPGISKGTATENKTRILAIQSFNSKNYETAIGYYQNLETINTEDKYYYGLALLKNEKYIEALQQFESSAADSDRFQQELNWYQSLAYLLAGDSEKAEEVLQRIRPDEWNYEKAHSLLENIKDTP